MRIFITKRDGSREAFNADRINKSIERACAGIADPISKVVQIATETRLMLYDGITTQEMDYATINAALQNVQEDIAYDKIACRILLKTVYKEILGDYGEDREELEKLHTAHFSAYIADGVAEGLLDERMAKKFNVKKLAKALALSRDELLEYAGLSTLLNRYTMKDRDQQPLETPQYFFMRVAMGLSYNEKDPTAQAIQFYDSMSQLDYLAGGSTNIGAGTSRPALSNCFLLGMISFSLGLTIVLLNNVWQGSGILVTIIGWLAVIKGIAYIFFPQALRTGVSRAKAPMTGVVVLALVVGIALLYVGYTLPAGSATWQQNTPAQHYEMPAAPYPTNSL